MVHFFKQLVFDPLVIDERISKKIGIWEFFALVFSVSTVVGFILVEPNSLHYDLSNYLKTVNGDFSFYYYAYWFVPILEIFGKLPIFLSYFLWNIISIYCVFVGARIFGGRAEITLVSFQMCYILFQGQITGWIIGALGLLWWGMAHKKWSFAGLGFLIASTKFQSGFFFAIILLLFADISWKDRLRVIILPIFFFGFSLILFPEWPFHLLSVIQNNPPNDWGNLALWQWIGPFALLLWIPPIILPLPSESRIIALICTTSLALPYFQQYDLLTLFVLPIGLIPIVGNLGFLTIWIGYTAHHILAIIPLSIYLIIISKSFIKIYKDHQ